jgi:sugar transferase (PEP-CTERM/EpsH1 system associated)
LLHLTHRLPYPPDKGDRIRTYHTLKYLSSGGRVHLAALADEPPQPGAVEALQALCERVAVIPHAASKRWLWALGSLIRGRSITEGVFHSPALVELLAMWCGEVKFAGVLASSSAMAPYLQRGALSHVPAVVDLVDVDSQKWFDYAQASRIPRKWLYRLEGQRLRKLEQSLPAWTRGVVLTTPAEVALFETFAGKDAARVVANGVDLDYFRPAPQSREVSCVFVGALDYRPNVDGVVWFCETVWPKILQRRGEAKLYIVGRKPVAVVQKLAEVPGVEVIGTVPDVRPWVERAAVAVVPLRIARGVQNKILEALAMERAVVASPVCLGGLQTIPGQHLLAATMPDEWVTTLLSLFDDVERRQRLGAAGRAFVEEHHCWDRCLEPLAQLLLTRGEST